MTVRDDDFQDDFKEEELIDIEKLMKAVDFDSKEKALKYVRDYKIFVVATRDHKNSKKYLFHETCVKIRNHLLKFCLRYPKKTLREIGALLGEVCGNNDELLLDALDKDTKFRDILKNKKEDLRKKLEPPA